MNAVLDLRARAAQRPHGDRLPLAFNSRRAIAGGGTTPDPWR
jgi:hypothetical protein